MGCWNGTCMISNLPILAGEKVKLVFLHSPYGRSDLEKSAYCYPNGIFQPGGFALDAEYNDYGSVENIIEDINYDLITLYFQQKYKKIKVEEKELQTFTLYNIIEGIERGSLELFCEGDIERKKLAQKAVETYSKSGYSTEKIKKEWEDMANIDVSEQWRTNFFNFVMIRADVWEYICKYYNTEFWKEPEDRTHTKDYYQPAQEWVDKRFAKYIKEKENISQVYKGVDEAFIGKYVTSPLSMNGYAGGSNMFMEPFYSIALNNCISTDKSFTYLKNLFLEVTIIDSVLSSTRKGSMIVSGAGSQSQEWDSYKL